MENSGWIRVCACGNGRVHVQVGFVTLCLEAQQFAELVKKGSEALRSNEREERGGSPSSLAH
jgi:hypothetical protein